MNKLWKILQYGYLVVAVILFIDAISRWNLEREQAYFSIIFAVFMLVLFFFKRKFRQKIEERNRNRQR